MPEIKLVTEEEMSEILKERHQGRRDNDTAIYQLADTSNVAIDNPFLYKNKAKVLKGAGTDKISIVLDTRAVMELDRGYLGKEQIQTYEFEIDDLTGVPTFIGMDIIAKDEFSKKYTDELPPENIKLLLNLIDEEVSERKNYTYSF